MPKMKIDGIDEYMATLRKVSDNTQDVLKKAVYEGASVSASELKRQVEALPSVNDNYNLVVYANKKSGKRDTAKYKLSATQKKGLLNSLGIAPFNVENGVIDTHIGFDGYNNIKTKKYPQGQPNILIARVVESGSSYFNKTPFIRKAIKNSKKKTEEVMTNVINEEINRLTKE